MRSVVAVVVVASFVAPASADVSIDIKAKDPVAKLPLIAANKQNFLRAFKTLRKGCKRPDIWVEAGGIEPTVDEPQYSKYQLRGGCNEAIDEYDGNVPIINESMKGTNPATAAVKGAMFTKLPAQITVDGMPVHITANATSAHVTVNRFAAKDALAGGRRMTTTIVPDGVRAYYVVDLGTQKQIAILLSGRQADGTIVQQWMEVWARKVAAPQPIDIARTWLLAVAAKDGKTLAATTHATTFQRVGFEPAGATAAACAKTRVAKKAAEVQPVLDCVLAESAVRYASLFDEQGFTKITAGKAPVELKPHAKTIAALGGTLLAFESSDERGAVATVISVVKDKVTGAVEVHVPIKK